MAEERPMPPDLVERVCRVVAQSLELPSEALPVTRDTRLFGGGLGLDSIEALRLVAALEEELDVEIDDEALTVTHLGSVGSVARLVFENLGD
ncbi:acyl carrier protein [Gemmatimonadota bacterium]